MTAIIDFLEQRNPTQPIEPATPEQLQAQKEARLANVVRLEFWNDEFTFQNGNGEEITGQINNYTHMAKLSIRAMELARDEGKKLIEKNGMDTSRLEQVTDEDIEEARADFRRYGAQI